MGDISKCANCGCDLLASVKDCPVLGFVEGIQIVRRGLSETSIESE